MTDISASSVMALRQKTGVSMMECKKALSEAGGDEEKAVELLRKQGAMKASSKAERATSEGAVAIYKNAIASIRCETDFVGRNSDFRAFVDEIAREAAENGVDAAKAKFEEKKGEKITQLGENITLGDIEIVNGEVLGGYVHTTGKVGALVGMNGGNEQVASDIAMHATAMNPAVLSPSEVSDELVAKEKEIWRDQLKQEGKPENILENILMGKEKKFREESALIKQPFVKEQEKSVESYAKEHGAEIKAFARIAV